MAVLSLQDADDLYVRLQAQRGVACDSRLHDVSCATIAEARGEPGKPWWDYTTERKVRQAAGTFNLRAIGPERRKDKSEPRDK